MPNKSAALEKEMKVRSAKPNKWLRFYRCIPLYLMFLPGALYLLMDKYIPMSGLIIAFKKVNWRKGILASDWVGFSNFTYLFKTKDAFNITRNTLLYNLCFIVLGTVIAITIAILLNEITSKLFKQVYQTIILMPYLISIVVVSYLVFAMLSSESGFINNTIFKALGINPISWYTEPKYWPFILVIVHIWKVFGYDCILYYATLVGIDHGYYEAAVIEKKKKKPLAADRSRYAAEPSAHHHHADTDVYRQDFLFRFRSVLSGADGFRPAARHYEHD